MRTKMIYKKSSIFLLISCCLILVFSTCKKEITAGNLSASKFKYLIGGINDKVQKIERTKDGGFLFCGYTITENANTQAFLLKVDGNGRQEWYRTYGGKNFDLFNSAIQCSDGGFVGVGRTTMLGSGAFTDMDLVIKTDANGKQMWSKSFTDGTGALSELRSVTESKDHFIYATGNYPSTSVWMAVFLLKLDLQGNMIYSKAIEGLQSYKPNKFDAAHPVGWAGGMDISINEMEKIIIGADLAIYSTPSQTVPSLLSINPSGSVNFYYPYLGNSSSCSYSPSNNSPITKVVPTSDGNYICWNSDSINAKGTKQCIKLLKTDISGNPIWLKVFNGIGNALAFDMNKSADGTLYLSGCTSLTQADNSFPESFINARAYVIKVDATGNIIEELNLGNESNVSIFKSTQISNDGSLTAAGYSSINSSAFHKMFITTLNLDND